MDEPMTLNEAIQHAWKAFDRKDLCEECRSEHKQLALWLEELRDTRSDKAPHGHWIYRGTEKGFFCSN